MEKDVAQRWQVEIEGRYRPPQVYLDPHCRPQLDPTRRGVTVYEFDWQRMVKLSAAEALDLLAFLRDSEAVLQQMAREDAEVLLEVQRQTAERSWQASTQTV